jgi:lysophospholipase L1-like esterase
MLAGMRDAERVVACLGSSSTAAIGCFDWIAELQKRPRNAGLRFVNLGVNGDLAWNALQRIGDVIARRPDLVVVLIGGNDVMALVAARRMQRIYKFRKRLPRAPSPEWFRENLQAIARRLKTETQARVGLASLQPMGEDPNPTDAFQREINRRVVEYNEMIRKIASEDGASYLPFYERMEEQIVASPGRALESVSFGAFYRSKFRQFVLRRSFDEVARADGWKFHVDGVHLNTQGGMILAEVVQEFVGSGDPAGKVNG